MANRLTQNQANENYAQLQRLRKHEKIVKEWSRKNHIKDFMALSGPQWKALKKKQRQERRLKKKAIRQQRQGRQPQVAKTQSEI